LFKLVLFVGLRIVVADVLVVNFSKWRRLKEKW